MRRRANENGPDFFLCPHCGAEVPRKALACPSCGSDENTGWSEEARYIHLLPDRDLPPERPTKRFSWRNSIALGLIAACLIVCMLRQAGFYANSVMIPVVILAGGLLYVLYQFYRRSPAVRESESYLRLVQLTRGDRAQAERLIEYERSRNPIATRSELIQDAIDRLLRDRR